MLLRIVLRRPGRTKHLYNWRWRSIISKFEKNLSWIIKCMYTCINKIKRSDAQEVLISIPTYLPLNTWMHWIIMQWKIRYSVNLILKKNAYHAWCKFITTTYDLARHIRKLYGIHVIHDNLTLSLRSHIITRDWFLKRGCDLS